MIIVVKLFFIIMKHVSNKRRKKHSNPGEIAVQYFKVKNIFQREKQNLMKAKCIIIKRMVIYAL